MRPPRYKMWKWQRRGRCGGLPSVCDVFIMCIWDAGHVSVPFRCRPVSQYCIPEWMEALTCHLRARGAVQIGMNDVNVEEWN